MTTITFVTLPINRNIIKFASKFNPNTFKSMLIDGRKSASPQAQELHCLRAADDPTSNIQNDKTKNGKYTKSKFITPTPPYTATSKHIYLPKKYPKNIKGKTARKDAPLTHDAIATTA